jgi:PAS domain-containing protein
MYKSFKPEDLMAVLEGIADAVVKLDADSNYVAMNGAAADIFRRLGRDPQQMLGNSIWELFLDVKGTIVERKIREMLEHDVHIQYEFLSCGSALV